MFLDKYKRLGNDNNSNNNNPRVNTRVNTRTINTRVFIPMIPNEDKLLNTITTFAIIAYFINCVIEIVFLCQQVKRFEVHFTKKQVVVT